MNKFNKKRLFFSFTILIFLSACYPPVLHAFEETIIIPAENPEGVTLDLQKGQYIVEIEGGAITLFYPVNPNYRWLVAVAIGTDVNGKQDEPNIGMLYFEPSSIAYTQAEAEKQLLEAIENRASGTFLKFILDEDKTVRFWVSDFDYTDNSGMIKLRIMDNNSDNSGEVSQKCH